MDCVNLENKQIKAGKTQGDLLLFHYLLISMLTWSVAKENLTSYDKQNQGILVKRWKDETYRT